MKKQFDDERKAIVEAFKNGGEDAAIKAIDQKGMQKLLTGIYVEVMDHFGSGLMDQFKKDAGNHMETKAPLIALEKIFNVFDKAVQKFISTTVAKKVVGITQTTEKKLRSLIKKSEAAGESIEQIAAKIDTLYLDQIIPNRSEVIARTEVIGASNAGNAYAADQTGLNLEKSWLSTRDERTRESHDTVDGQKKPKHEHYDVGKAKLMFPGDPEGPAEEVIQCRCTETYKVIKGAAKPKPAAEPTKQMRFNQENYEEILALRDKKLEKYWNTHKTNENSQFYNMTLEQYKQWHDDKVSSLVAGAGISVRAPSDVVKSIVAAGRFKTQFETNTSKGVIDFDGRAKIEKQLFGYADGENPANRPIYGALTDGSNWSQTSQYGDAIFVVDRKKVESRTTFVFGDSLVDPEWVERTPVPLMEPTRAASSDLLFRFKDLSRCDPYPEVQIHEGLSMDEIQEIIFEWGEPDAQTIEILKSKNIKWRVGI